MNDITCDFVGVLQVEFRTIQIQSERHRSRARYRVTQFRSSTETLDSENVSTFLFFNVRKYKLNKNELL